MGFSLLELPVETAFLISSFLPAPDVLSLISTHSVLYRSCGKSETFWKGISRIQFREEQQQGDLNADSESDTQVGVDLAKKKYILQAHCNSLAAVRWNAALSATTPSAREGHVSCRLGHFVVLTGGFTDDNTVYIKDTRVASSSWQRVRLANDVEPEWVYGASLTALDDTRAIRFGGFQSGGYSDESCQVAVLHFNAVDMTMRWEVVSCMHADGSTIDDEDCEAWSTVASRAYHSATLLSARYLFIVGGMKSSMSILSPMVLDCHTWTWYVDGITTQTGAAPSPRHGCSVVLDYFRNRLVLFGGGDGSDLLRSGQDNTEVWALNLNGFGTSSSSERTSELRESLPWVWQCIHADQSRRDDVAEGLNHHPNRLSPVEKLNLGRCHSGHRVSRDSVLLLFGSGRPTTTNSVLSYNLAKDEFFRPAVCGPYLPRGRFTFASTFVESLGYIVVHGGFSNQDTSGALSDTIILDLAPKMHNRQSLLWPVNARAAAFPPVTNEDIEANTNIGRAQSIMQHIMETLVQTDQADRAAAAAQIITNWRGTERLEGRFAMMLHLIASGRVEVTDDGSIREAMDRDE